MKFKIPADVVRALGGNDTPLGLAVLHNTFGNALHPLAGVTATVPAELVKEIGNGDINVGRRVLNAFIAKVREDRMKTKAS